MPPAPCSGHHLRDVLSECAHVTRATVTHSSGQSLVSQLNGGSSGKSVVLTSSGVSTLATRLRFYASIWPRCPPLSLPMCPALALYPLSSGSKSHRAAHWTPTQLAALCLAGEGHSLWKAGLEASSQGPVKRVHCNADPTEASSVV